MLFRSNARDVDLYGAPATFHSDDTPNISLYNPQNGMTEPFLGLTAREFHASTYLMYRPVGVFSIWVALAKLDWGFQGSVTYLKNVGGPSQRVLIPIAFVKASNFNTVLTSPVDEPTWTSVIPNLSLLC